MVLGVGYLVVGEPLRQAYGEANAAVADARRLLTAAERNSERRAALERSVAADTGGPLLLSGESDGSATAALQTLLQSVLEDTAAELISVEALPSAPDGAYSAIRLRAQFSIGHDALPRALHALESGRPVVFLDNLTISARSARAVGVERPLDVRVDLTAYRPGKG